MTREEIEIYDTAITVLEKSCEDCVSRDAIRLKIAEIPKYTEGRKSASIRHIKDFMEKELEEPLDVTQDMCIGFTIALEYIRDFVKALPPVTPTQKWIPVSEKSPDKEGFYLASVKNEHGRRYSKTCYYMGKNHWFARQEVEAWMPSLISYEAKTEVADGN